MGFGGNETLRLRIFFKTKSALLSRKQGENQEEPTWININFFHYELLREWLSSKGIGFKFL